MDSIGNTLILLLLGFMLGRLHGLWLDRMNDEYFKRRESSTGTAEQDCGHICGYQEPYGFVPEADCPVHDTAETDEQEAG